MKTTTKETKEYVLTEEEMKQVKDCVNYCWHRKIKHGSKQFDADKLDQLRIALGIVKETDILGDHLLYRNG